MDAIAESKFGGAESHEKLVGEPWRTAEDRQERLSPVFDGFGGHRGRGGGGGHLAFAPARSGWEGAVDCAAGAVVACLDGAFRAGVKPAGGPEAATSFRGGQGVETVP